MYFSNIKMQLNKEQLEIFEDVKNGKNVLITSPAGTGKSFILRYIYLKFSKIYKIALTSTTGVSAVLLKGSTIYHCLGLGLGIEDEIDLFKKINYNKDLCNYWKELQILIIDEISMMSDCLFDKINFVAQKIRKNSEPFGGIQIILSGDFLQLPVIGRENKFVYHSKCWDDCEFNYHCMKTIIRQDELLFKNILLKIRIGEIDDQVLTFLKSRENVENDNKDIYPTKLFCLKKYVENLNNSELLKLKEKKFTFVCKFKKTCKLTDLRSFEIYRKLFIQNSTTPENLVICKDAQVMLTFNLDTAKGLCNGSRGVVKGFTPFKYPIIQFLNGEVVSMQPQKWDIINKNKNIIGFFKQIPLKIAYALTIHSCQGLTLDCAEIDLMRAFEYGQVYTALSRVKNKTNLFLKNVNVESIKINPDALEFYKNMEKNVKNVKNEDKNKKN